MAHIRKKANDKYQVLVFLGMDEENKRRYRSIGTFPSRRAASSAALVHDTQQKRATRGRKLSSDAIEIVWKSWVNEHSEKWSPNTLETHTNTLRYCEPLHGRPLHKISAKEITDLYASWRNKGLTLSTVVRRHAVLSSFFNWAIKRGRLTFSPMADVPTPVAKLAPVYVPDVRDIEKFLAFLLDRDPEYRLFLRLALATGMRRGELVALRFEDLRDGELRIVRVSVAGKGGRTLRDGTKNGTVNKIALYDDLAAELEELRRPGYIFSVDNGTNPWSLSKVTHYYSNYAKEAGLSIGRLHDLRHLHATESLTAGYSVKQVAARLGHKRVETTLNRYAAAMPSVDRDLANEIGKRLLG